MLNTPNLAAIRSKIEARIDRLEERLDDPKEMERMMQNPLAYAAFAVAAVTPVAVIADAFINHRFAWWGLIMGVFMFYFGKALYIPSEKSKLPTAEQVRNRLNEYKDDAERKLESIRKSVTSNTSSSETVKA